MTITIHLPADLETILRNEDCDLEAAAKEALLIDLFRRERISRAQLSAALGLGRIETDGVLKKHEVSFDLPTTKELEADVATLKRLLGQ